MEAVKQRKLTGAEYLINNLDGKLIDEDLNDIGNRFASAYYDEEAAFAEKYGNYSDDFDEVFSAVAQRKGVQYPTFYHVENTWDNYFELKPTLDKRFMEWKQYRD